MAKAIWDAGKHTYPLIAMQWLIWAILNWLERIYVGSVNSRAMSLAAERHRIGAVRDDHSLLCSDLGVSGHWGARRHCAVQPGQGHHDEEQFQSPVHGGGLLRASFARAEV